MSSSGPALPPQAYAAALVRLPGFGPARLCGLLDGRTPEQAWACIRSTEAARSIDVAGGWADLVAAGVTVTARGSSDYPAAFDDDPDPPAVLFARGDLARVEGRRVAIVGARECTRYGAEVAFQLGRDLAANGVQVVSGLALGIDGAAHRGAVAAAAGAGRGGLAAPPIAVVGSGLDIVYPRRNATLWREVEAAGVVLTEAPLGAPPEAWRFPVRNRIVAALAEVVVVVESRHRGGSRHTVDAALDRDRPVLAVPGPVLSPQSELPNALLAEGCHPARDALDVLVALDLRPSTSCGTAAPDVAGPATPEGPAGAVLDALGWQRASFEDIVVACGRSPGEVGLLLAGLERDGWVRADAGTWERVHVR